MNANSENQQINYVEEDEIDLRELWQTIRKGKKTILIVMVVVVTLTFIYALKTPNTYTSQSILIPSSETQSSAGGLGGLAALAGISMGGGVMTPDVAFKSLLGDYDFMEKFVLKNKVWEYYDQVGFDKDYVFALGFRGLYDLFQSEKDKTDMDMDKEIFSLVKQMKKKMAISADKKSGLITIAYSDADRFYPPVIIKAFLKDATAYLVKNNLKIINHKLKYYENELLSTDSFELRQGISAMYTQILQEKVILKSKQYYQCDVLTEPFPAYIKDKTKPKRGLILVVAFITSIILGIFLVFFLEFIKKNKEEEDKPNE